MLILGIQHEEFLLSFEEVSKCDEEISYQGEAHNEHACYRYNLSKQRFVMKQLIYQENTDQTNEEHN